MIKYSKFYFLNINQKNNYKVLYMYNATRVASIILSLSGMYKHTDLLIYNFIVMIPLNYLRFNKIVNF